MRKILYSPGFGAGWVSWAGGSKEFRQWMLTYQPLIDAIESKDKCKFADALEKFRTEAKERFHEEPYLGGASDLQVAVVHGQVRIYEYDGSESYEEQGDYEGWL